MKNSNKYPSDVVFTPTVKKVQEQYGSRRSYARMEKGSGWNTIISSDLESFLNLIDSFYFGTANLKGQPYIQHRGGEKGFLKKLDDHHLAFLDYSGNRQYISIGNIEDNNKVTLFLMHYPTQSRIKIWGTASISNDADLIEQLKDADYKARIDRVIIIKVSAWDVNCRQHIKQRFSTDQIEKVTQPLKDKIKELELKLQQYES